jgi:hypothetical protein
MRRTSVLLVTGLLTACGGGGDPVVAGDGPGEPQRYTVSTTVLESPAHGPQLCIGGVADSYPPQCGGPDVVGWDWAEVDGAQSASGTTWGDFTVVGTWDGAALTLTEPPGPPSPSTGREADLSTPCPAPPGGWAVVDPAKLGGQGAALAYADAEPDFAGAWLDQSTNPASDDRQPDESAMNDPARLVLNVRFTGDLERHEAEIRERWGGPLCVTEGARTIQELLDIQQEVGEELGALGSGIDSTIPAVEVSVLVAEEGLQASLDERFGEGAVIVTGALRPVP